MKIQLREGERKRLLRRRRWAWCGMNFVQPHGPKFGEKVEVIKVGTTYVYIKRLGRNDDGWWWRTLPLDLRLEKPSDSEINQYQSTLEGGCHESKMPGSRIP